MATTWPDPTVPAPSDNLQADGNTLTGTGGARDDLNTAVALLNSILTCADVDVTLVTSGNDGYLMRMSPATTNGEIAVLNTDPGQASASGKTIATSVTATNNTVPTSNAVKTYVDGASGPTMYSGEIATDGTSRSLPAGWTSAAWDSGSSRYQIDTGTDDLTGANICVSCEYDGAVPPLLSVATSGTTRFYVYALNDNGTGNSNSFYFQVMIP